MFILNKKLTIHLTFKIAIFSALLGLMTGCDQNKLTAEQPSEVAIEFFDAIYNEQDLQQATLLATPQYGRILKSYYTVEQVQKVLFNRRFDKVTIEEDKDTTGLTFTDVNAQKAYVTLMFDGTFNGERHRDLKQVVMLKQNGKWRVDKLKADVYR